MIPLPCVTLGFDKWPSLAGFAQPVHAPHYPNLHNIPHVTTKSKNNDAKVKRTDGRAFKDEDVWPWPG